ncbi:MAG: hypothetical protein LBE67_07405 [Kocuria palustris]|nr:hypothetical protein [Kocuria palustris]GLU85515.1 hypothetical protein Kosp01_02610 [Kocuria sp. NBRC 114282]
MKGSLGHLDQTTQPIGIPAAPPQGSEQQAEDAQPRTTLPHAAEAERPGPRETAVHAPARAPEAPVPESAAPSQRPSAHQPIENPSSATATTQESTDMSHWMIPSRSC